MESELDPAHMTGPGIIERGDSTSSYPTLLFVHGFWQAAWTWDEFVMPVLAERGCHCDRYVERLERASYRVYMSMLLGRPDLSNVDLPAVVIGGSEDGFFTEREWQDTADALGADLVMLNGIGHQPMWEGEGRALVDEIDGFVTGLT